MKNYYFHYLVLLFALKYVSLLWVSYWTIYIINSSQTVLKSCDENVTQACFDISKYLLKVCDLFYASAFRRLWHYVFGLSVRPSVRPSEAWNTLFWPVHGSVGPPDQPLPFYGMSARPSVRPSVHLSVRPSVRPSIRPERFPGICRRMHGGISLKFYMLMYLDHLQNW